MKETTLIIRGARQSGKSTAIIAGAEKFARMGIRCLVMAPTYLMLERLSERIEYRGGLVSYFHARRSGGLDYEKAVKYLLEEIIVPMPQVLLLDEVQMALPEGRGVEEWVREVAQRYDVSVWAVECTDRDLAGRPPASSK